MRNLARNIRFLAALTATNLKASLALRGAFWLQASFMLLNNLAFFVTWLIFFHRFGQVRGWRLPDMVVLYGVVAASYGLFAVVAGGAMQLARAIADGELDPLLVQPKPPLIQAVASRSIASGWGDFATGLGFLAIVAARHPTSAFAAIAAVLLSASVFVSTAVIVQSLAFWLGRIETLARQAVEIQLMFGLYPGSVFTGALRVLLFTAIPAGFVGYLPAQLVRAPTPGAALGLAAGAGVFFALALLVFSRGLRVYESGSRFGSAG